MNGTFRIATWNVNSVRARKEHLLKWLHDFRPDVVCLQELKTTDDAFPFDELEDAGYHAETNSQKTYNGVAILSRTVLTDVTRGMGDDDPQARLITARAGKFEIISAYFPNGSEPDSDKYAYKKDWLARFNRWFIERYGHSRDVVLCGDFNIAPTASDVNDESLWEGTVIYNPEMRAAFAAIESLGLIDVFRKLNPEGGAYSWWDYRAGGFRRNIGLRLDYIMASRSIADSAVFAAIDKNQRALEKPSDHAPVYADLKIA